MTYRIYTEVNAADTCRDPDDIYVTELGCTSDLEKAKQFAEKYIREHFFYKKAELFEYNDGYAAQDICSYGATLIIKKMKEL